MRRGILGLTKRQETYLRATCNGIDRAEVAAREYVSAQAIRSTMTRVYRTLAVRDAAEACYRLGVEDHRAHPDAEHYLGQA